jgi:hypothetical protein
MAAAAIASGAVALVDDVAAGEFAGADVTGIATATGLGVVADGAAGWPKAAGSAVEAFPEDGFSGDFAVPALAMPDFIHDRWTASALAEALASEACWAAAFLSAESLLAVRSAAAALREPVLSGDAAALSDGRGAAADGGCGVGVAASLPVSAGMLESTSVPKLSLLCEASGRADLGAAVWKDMLVAASDVTLYTGGLSR